MWKINHDLPRAKHALKRLHTNVGRNQTNTKSNQKLALAISCRAAIFDPAFFFHTEFNKQPPYRRRNTLGRTEMKTY
ncbi:hypothetical protein CS542_06020 [Pedobacter sp. IW39]|nr:hypothetical protein CS542_06020 [Pedobacter sp. IW39]